MAEAKKKKKVSAKKAADNFKAALAGIKNDQTAAWFLDNGWVGFTTQYNQFADNVMLAQDLYLCVVDTSNQQIRQYTTQSYQDLTKYNSAWVGFYPSAYEVEITLDEAGNKGKKPVNDWDELKNMPNLNRGEKMYFAGRQYNLVKADIKAGNAATMGWQACAEDKRTSQTGIYVRSIGSIVWIFNYALNSHKTRTNHGSSGSIMVALGTFMKKTILDEDRERPFLEDPCEEEMEW